MPRDNVLRTGIRSITNGDHGPDGSHGGAPWPFYTQLIQGPSGKYGLTVQNHEVKSVVRKAIPLVLANICFVNTFPSSVTQAAWSLQSLVSAARKIKRDVAQSSEHVAMRYDAIKERLKNDEEYSPILSRLVRCTRHPVCS